MRYDGGPESGCFCPCMSFADLFVICREKSAFRKERKDGRIRCPPLFFACGRRGGDPAAERCGGRSGENEPEGKKWGGRGMARGGGRIMPGKAVAERRERFLPVRGTEGRHGMRGRNGWRRLFIPAGRLMVACPGAASSLPTRMLLAGVFRKGAADGKARAGERNARGGSVRAD